MPTSSGPPLSQQHQVLRSSASMSAGVCTCWHHGAHTTHAAVDCAIPLLTINPGLPGLTAHWGCTCWQWGDGVCFQSGLCLSQQQWQQWCPTNSRALVNAVFGRVPAVHMHAMYTTALLSWLVRFLHCHALHATACTECGPGGASFLSTDPSHIHKVLYDKGPWWSAGVLACNM